MNTKGVEDGMSDEQKTMAAVVLDWMMRYRTGEITSYSATLLINVVRNYDARSNLPQPEKFVCTDPECFGDCHPIRAVPVEERTAMPKCTCSWIGSGVGWRRPMNCPSHGLYAKTAPPIPAPIPEERTAEMDPSMKEIRSNLAAIYDATIEQDHGIAILAERCLKLLDHIEGKGK